jgi:hypothetical protein
MKNELVANGFERWKKAQAEKVRETLRAKNFSENPPTNFLNRTWFWFKTELECLRQSKPAEKSSPKILW